MKIQENIALAPYTTFKIGGPARFFCEAKSEDEILGALEFAREKDLPVFVLGGGSNVLVADKGFNGLVIKILNTQYIIHNTQIECGAGVALGKVVNESIKAGLTGLEWAIGVPGTVAGAARGNAGCFGGEMSDLVKEIGVIDLNDFSRKKLNNKDCEFDYRDSIFKRNKKFLITKVIFELAEGNTGESRKKIAEISKKRKEVQPVGLACPGSFFKNPETNDKNLIRQFETDTGKKVTDHVSGYQYTGNKIKIPAPWLIEEVGLKGKKIGGAMVSDKHANFIVNTGKATAEDVVMLAAIIKTKVRNKFGIQLQKEVQMVGF